MSDPAVRHRAVGALLLRRYLAGPQDITMAGGASETARIWKSLGGHIVGLRSITWIRVFNLPSTAAYLLKRLGKSRLKPIAYPLLVAAQAATDRTTALSLWVKEPTTRTEDLSPRALLECLPSMSNGLRIRPDYDERFLSWLFDEMAKVRSRGALIRRLVRDPNGRILGWYVAYLQPGGVSHTLQIGAKDRDVEAVIDHLFYEAQQRRVAFLTGQLESRLLEPLTRRRCVFHPVTNFLVHSRNREILNTVLAGQAMISGMEGEEWMGHEGEALS
jgi:hypothetical protein